MSLKSWLVAGIVPGVSRAPLKKLGADENAVLRLLHRWREEATTSRRRITRVVVAFEAGRDGFWLARWLRAVGSRPTSFTRPALLCRGSIGGRKPTGLTRKLLKRAFSAGCGGNRSIVRWRLFARCRKRMRGARTVSAIALCGADPDRQPDEERPGRLGIRGFNPKLRKAAERLEELVTPEGEAFAAEHPRRVAARSPWAVNRIIRRWLNASNRPPPAPENPTPVEAMAHRLKTPGRQEGLCSAQNRPQNRCLASFNRRSDSVNFCCAGSTRRARVEPCDNGLEHQTDVSSSTPPDEAGREPSAKEKRTVADQIWAVTPG